MGIVLEGIGTYLPERIVTNEAWPKDVVERWQQNRTWSPERAERALASIDNEGARKVLRAMAEVADDPFQGSRERRYMPEGMTAVDMQVEAAQRAMADAGVSARDIDFVLGSSLVPDLLNAHDVCGVHERLGIPAECFTIATEAVCNSFQMQLRLAEGLLRTRCRCGLLVQCSAASRTTPMEQPFSVHFGDGATAVVVRDAGHDRGLLSLATLTDGSLRTALVVTVPEKQWWEEGHCWSHIGDREAARRMFLEFPDVGRLLVAKVCRQAGVTPDDVQFFAGHQATVWWRRVAQEHAGLTTARTLDSYPWAGTINAGNLPLVLAHARREGMLQDGTLVAMFQAGTGATYAASIYRW